jgi:hypothetical protein
VHADEAARQRERVDHRIAHGEEEEIGIGLAARAGREGRPALAEIVQVLEDGVVVEVIAVAPDVAHDLLAELALDDGRQVGARGIAQRRQGGVGRAQDGRGRRRQRAGGGRATQAAVSRERSARFPGGESCNIAGFGFDFTML